MKTIIPTPEINAPAHDLVASAHRPPLPDHWEQGITFIGEDIFGTPASGEVILEGVTTKSAANAITDNGVEYTPFLIEVGVARPAASYSDQEREDIARRAIERGQRYIIETAMYTGSVLGNQFLVDANSTTISGGTYDPAAALGALQTEFARGGGQGTIYISPILAEILSDRFEERDGKLWTTVRGDLVIVGSYGQTGPEAAAAGAGTEWMIGHLGIPCLLLSDIFVYDSFDHTNNEPVVRAERVAAVVWNPMQWAVVVDVVSTVLEP